MSVIQTIRNRYGKIAGAVIAIALIGFIVSDARNGSFGNFLGGHDTNVMKVDGVKVDPKEYQKRLKEFETLNAIYNPGRTFDDVARAQMDEQIVQNIVYEIYTEEQCDKLGILTTDDEKKELIYGPNVDPMVRQFELEGNPIFINRDTKQFDPSIIKEFEKELNEQAQKIDPTGKYREQWETVKEYVLRNNRINKFNTMFSRGLYSPFFIAKHSAEEQNSMASIKYVKIPFTVVADNDVKVSDDDIKAYMQKHAALFNVDEPTRSIEYVSFEINPSSADTARALNALEEMKSDFATTKDMKSFVNGKSDTANSYSEAYLNKRTFLSRFADTLMQLPEGSIYGPYLEGGNYKMTKIISKKTLPDSVKCRHILVRTKAQGNEIRTDSAAKMKIDSAIAEIKAGAKFDSVVNKYSEDDGSKAKGGEYTFDLLQKPTLAKEFGDFIFDGKTGESKLVKVSNDNYAGYHYIEILEQKGIAPAVQIATIVKNLAPSDSTVNGIYGKANEFAGKNTTADAFDAAVKKQNLDKRIGDNIKVNNFIIPGIGPSREVVRWMYDKDRKIGDVSMVFQLGQQRYVVAKLVAIQEKGLASLTPMERPMVEQRVREEKKAEMIAKKYTGSLEAIASASGQQVMQADSIRLGSPFIPNLGFEPKVTGYIFNNAFQPNTLSPAISGKGGVYFITVLSRNSEQLPTDQNVLFQILGEQRRNQEMQLMNAATKMMQLTISRKADVTYNASNF